ncbi:hypothetical protein Micbo1qcDRAFT_163254, partial [Microdochium bolleyi]
MAVCRRHLLPPVRRHQERRRLSAQLLPAGGAHLRSRAHQDPERPHHEPVTTIRPLPAAHGELPRLCAQPRGRRCRHEPRQHHEELRDPGRAGGLREDAPAGQEGRPGRQAGGRDVHTRPDTAGGQVPVGQSGDRREDERGPESTTWGDHHGS